MSTQEPGNLKGSQSKQTKSTMTGISGFSTAPASSVGAAILRSPRIFGNEGYHSKWTENYRDSTGTYSSGQLSICCPLRGSALGHSQGGTTSRSNSYQHYPPLQSQCSWRSPEEQFQQSQAYYGPLQASGCLIKPATSATFVQISNTRGRDILHDAGVLYGCNRSEGRLPTRTDSRQGQGGAVIQTEGGILRGPLHELRSGHSPWSVQQDDSRNQGLCCEEIWDQGSGLLRRISGNSTNGGGMSSSNEQAHSFNHGLGLQNQLGETNTANEQSQISGSDSVLFNLDGTIPEEKVILLQEELLSIKVSIKVSYKKLQSLVGRLNFYARAVSAARTFTRRMLNYLLWRKRGFRGEVELREDLLKDRLVVNNTGTHSSPVSYANGPTDSTVHGCILGSRRGRVVLKSRMVSPLVCRRETTTYQRPGAEVSPYFLPTMAQQLDQPNYTSQHRF